MKTLWESRDRHVYVRFVPNDCWIGVYWQREPYIADQNETHLLVGYEWKLYVCLLPMVVIRIKWRRFHVPVWDE